MEIGMDRPLLRLNYPAFNGVIKRSPDDTDWSLRRAERAIIHILKTGQCHKRYGWISAGDRPTDFPQGTHHFSNWQNQDAPYPDNPIAWEVAYG